jgi:hypothetical protein
MRTFLRNTSTFFIGLILFNSCAFHTGIIGDSTAVQDGNYTISRSVYGYAKTIHVFGIGGNRKRAIVHEARQNLYINFPLSANEAYANMAIDFKRSYFLFVGTTEAMVTADLIRFEKNTGSPMPDKYAGLAEGAFSFHKGDFVTFVKDGEMKEGVVYQTEPLFKILQSDFRLLTLRNVMDTEVETIYLTDPRKPVYNSKYKIGDTLELKLPENTKTAVVKGIGFYGLLLEHSGELFSISYQELSSMGK